MYQVENKAVAEAIESDSRHFTAVLDFGDFTIEKAQVGTIKPSFGSVQNETPCIGDVVSTQCEVQIIEIPENVNLEGKEFQLYLYVEDLEYELAFSGHNKLQVWADYTLESIKSKTLLELDTDYMPSIPKELIPICKLTVLKVVDNVDYYTLTCSDRLHFADKKYVSKLNYPTTSDKVMKELCEQISAEAEVEQAESYLKSSDDSYLLSSEESKLLTSTWQFTIEEKPTQYSIRQMIGYISAMRGKFAVTDRKGKIVQRWYNDGEVLNFDTQYIDEAEINAEKIYIKQLSCKDSGSAGDPSGRKMEFECPYISDTPGHRRLNELWRMIMTDNTSFTYYPCTFTQRLGDPRLDLWERFAYKDGFMLMLNMNYTFDGGLMLDVDSGGATDAEAEAVGTF